MIGFIFKVFLFFLVNTVYSNNVVFLVDFSGQFFFGGSCICLSFSLIHLLIKLSLFFLQVDIFQNDGREKYLQDYISL